LDTEEIGRGTTSTSALSMQEDMDNEVVKHTPTRKWVLSSDDDDDEDDNDTTPKVKSSKKKPTYSLEKLPQAISKLPKDEKPFLDPFPLPVNFRSDVVAALASKSMTVQTTRSFMTAVGAAMFSYKRKPSPDEYYNVAMAIASKYPFLKSKRSGKPYVSF